MNASHEKTRITKRRGRGSWLNIFRCGSSKEHDDEIDKSSPTSARSGGDLRVPHDERTLSRPKLPRQGSSSSAFTSIPVVVFDDDEASIHGEPSRCAEVDDLMPSGSELSKAANVSPTKHSKQCDLLAESPERADLPSIGSSGMPCDQEHMEESPVSAMNSGNAAENKVSLPEVPCRPLVDVLYHQDKDFTTKFAGTAIDSSDYADSETATNYLENPLNRTMSIETVTSQRQCIESDRVLSSLRSSPGEDCVQSDARTRESWGFRDLLRSLVGSSIAPSVSSASAAVSAVDLNRFLASKPFADSAERPCVTSPSGRIVSNIADVSRMRLPADAEVVWLNIYDVKQTLQLVNDLAKQVGSGAFHAGVEVFGQEWSFGWKEFGSGVYFAAPMGNDRHKYRESVAMGATALAKGELSSLMSTLRDQWLGNDYDLLTRNCCHFADAMCRELGVGQVPEWVMHLASAGVSIVEGVDQAVSRAQEAAELAVNKAAEFDERYQISRNLDSFLHTEIDIDEAYLEEAARGFFTRAKEKFDSVGALAGQVLNDVEGARRRFSGREISTQPHSKDDQVFSRCVAVSPTPARGRRQRLKLSSPPANLQSIPGVMSTKRTSINANCVAASENGVAGDSIEGSTNSHAHLDAADMMSPRVLDQPDRPPDLQSALCDEKASAQGESRTPEEVVLSKPEDAIAFSVDLRE